MEKNASDLKLTATVGHIQAKAQNLKHEQVANAVPKPHPVAYELRQYLSILAVFMELK